MEMFSVSARNNYTKIPVSWRPGIVCLSGFATHLVNRWVGIEFSSSDLECNFRNALHLASEDSRFLQSPEPAIDRWFVRGAVTSPKLFLELNSRQIKCDFVAMRVRVYSFEFACEFINKLSAAVRNRQCGCGRDNDTPSLS